MSVVRNAVGEFILYLSLSQCNDIPVARGNPGAPVPTYNKRITCCEISLNSHVAGISSNFHPLREKTQHAPRCALFPLPPLCFIPPLHLALMHRHGISLAYCCYSCRYTWSTACSPIAFISLHNGVHVQGHLLWKNNYVCNTHLFPILDYVYFYQTRQN